MKIYNNSNVIILDITVDDKSYRNRVIMGGHNLTLYYSLAEHVELPVGSYCEFEGQTYTLMRPESFKMKHSRNFEYTVIFESAEAKAKIWKFRNIVDGRLKFSLTAKPREHLQMFVDNMNRRDSGWRIGSCIDDSEIVINYDHAYCYDALAQMASNLNTEFEFIGKTVSLGKLEYNKDNPLSLSYGRGNGFKPNVGRSNFSDSTPIEILYVQGGSTNIDKSKYGSSELLLPKTAEISYDGQHFDDELGFNPSNSRKYVTDNDGISIRRSDKSLASYADDSLDCSDIYPKRVGTVAESVVVDESSNFYDIIDPDTPNYEDYQIDGETMTIIFQSGMLAGKEFDVKYIHEEKSDKAGHRFEIVPQEIDGETMPNPIFSPKQGDTYAVFGCMLPDSYICDNSSKSGASWEMFRKGAKYLYENEQEKFTFTGELDGIWAKKDWMNIGGKIRLGSYILFSDERFQKDGVLIRITGIKDYINNPHSPVLTLSNSTVTCGFLTTIQEMQSEEIAIEENISKAMQFTKRRFRDAKETIDMLNNALLDNFTESISPVAVQTMMLLVGDESLQFHFVRSNTNPVTVIHNVRYDNTLKQLIVPNGCIQHMTLGINTLCSEHKPSEYLFWNMLSYTSPVLTESNKKYYLYAKVTRTASSGNNFILSENAISMKNESDYYYLLVGILNSEYNGERSFVTLYGFTEILPGRVTTDMIVSSDGNTYFDLANSVIKGKIDFIAGTKGYENIIDRPDLSHFVKDTDGIINIHYSSNAPTVTNAPAINWTDDAVKEVHIGDLYRQETSLMDPNTFENVYYWFRWEKNDGIFGWNRISPVPKWFSNIPTAKKMFLSVLPTTPYAAGDIWLNGGIFLKCKTAKTESEKFNEGDWDDAGIYDNTKTTIDGGLVTSGTVQLAGDNSNILAGITGNGTANTSVRIWAGASYVQRATAPFRVLQDGSVIMNNATITGKIDADKNSTFHGAVSIANGKILLNADGSGQLSNGAISWNANGAITIKDATITGKFTATKGLFLNPAQALTAGTANSPVTLYLGNYQTNMFFVSRNSNDNVENQSVTGTTIRLPSSSGVNILFVFLGINILNKIKITAYNSSTSILELDGNSTEEKCYMLVRKKQTNTADAWSITEL